MYFLCGFSAADLENPSIVTPTTLQSLILSKAMTILHLMAKPHLAHRIYHIGSGDERSCSFSDINNAFCDFSGRADRLMIRTSVDDACERKDEFPTIFGPCNKHFMPRAVRLYGGFASLNTVFDISRLIDEGVPLPPRFSDYLGVCASTSSEMIIVNQAMTDFI